MTRPASLKQPPGSGPRLAIPRHTAGLGRAELGLGMEDRMADGPRTAEITGKLADDYAAMVSLEHDMVVCLEGIDFLKSLTDTPTPAAEEHRLVVWMGIAVSYGRAFIEGRRVYVVEPFVPTSG